MQAALPIMNGARPSFGKPEVTAQQTRELAQTLNQITGTPTHIYHITTTEGSTDDQELINLGDEAVTYTTQYYTTVEPQSSTSSPRASPERDESGMLTPTSISSKESSSSDAGSEEDSPAGGSMSGDIKPQNICVKSSPHGGNQLQQTDHGHVCNGNSGNTVAGTTVKNWTYEDQFKQLYNVSPEPERKEFLDKLFDFMQRKGNPITRIPIMAKQPLDLYRLFKLVVERGGLVEVIKKKAWRNVAKELNLPASITSAAFTMRSQYQKYLYPYECETVKLSDPQELQMAIDSNKRDRRHSDTIPLGLGDAPNSVITTQAIKMIPSPTVPHAVSGSPYSGGYIVTPGGIMATGQIVQLPQVPGVPIVMSSQHHHVRSESSRTVSEDGDDETKSPMEPPQKKMAMEVSQAVKVALSSDSTGRLPYVHTTAAGNLIMAGPGGTPIVAHPSMGPTPQFIHMAAAAAGHHPASHIPIVLPTQTVVSSPTPTPLESTNTAAVRSIRVGGPHCSGEINDTANSRTATTTPLQEVVAAQRRTISMPVPVPVATIPPQTTTAATTNAQSPHQHGGGVLAIPPGSTHHLPAGLVSAMMAPAAPMPASPGKRKRLETPPPVEAGSGKKMALSTDSPSTPGPAATTSIRMPFTNISIQPTGDSNGDGSGSTDASLLVTLQLNSVVYQGVLFAKPSNSIALSNSSTPSR